MKFIYIYIFSPHRNWNSDGFFGKGIALQLPTYIAYTYPSLYGVTHGTSAQHWEGDGFDSWPKPR